MKFTKNPKYDDQFLKIPKMCTLCNIFESNLRRSKLPNSTAGYQFCYKFKGTLSQALLIIELTSIPFLIAPPSQPPWRNPNATAQAKTKKFHVSLYHMPAESRVSKKAPFAPRTFLGAPSVSRTGVFTPAVYNSLSDPHLNPYFSRKFGQTPPLRVSGASKPRVIYYNYNDPNCIVSSSVVES